MHAKVVSVAGHPASVAGLLDLAAVSLASAGVEVARVEVPARGLPVDDGGTDLVDEFDATPGALIESWRIARQIEAVTGPGDVVVVTDHRGAGGIFALEQVTLAPADRRIVWTVAGGSLMLELLDVAGTIVGVDAEDAAAIDWEIVQYRESSVTAIGAAVAAALADITDVTLLPVSPLPVSDSVGPVNVIGLPEPVSRRSHTFAALRGLHGPMEDDPSIRVIVSEDDQPDEIWQGTTWSTMSGFVESFAGRVARGDALAAETFVLGDRFSPPLPGVVEAAGTGKRVVVPEGSTAAAVYPTASTWTDEDSLAAALGGGAPAASPAREVPRIEPVDAADRAWRVSVGIPIYREVRYLDECVRSVLDQTQVPHEIILYDDGSRSPAVSQAMHRWERTEPDRIRTRRGPNRGVAGARNAILGEMSGDSFFLIDSDDVLEPTCLERCATTMRWNPELWAVATWTRFIGFYEAVEGRPPFDRRVGARENPIVSTAALVDMRVRDRGIEFAPDLAFLYCEDWYVWSQIVAAGGRIGLVPEPLVVHRARDDSGAGRRSPLAHALGKARATAPIVGAGQP